MKELWPRVQMNLVDMSDIHDGQNWWFYFMCDHSVLTAVSINSRDGLRSWLETEVLPIFILPDFQFDNVQESVNTVILDIVTN